jgi:serine/threonine protein kinase
MSLNEAKDIPEIKFMVQLKHINIVRLLEVIRDRNTIHMILEYCECSLFQCMQHYKNKAKSLSENQIRWIMKELLYGLGYLHVGLTR